MPWLVPVIPFQSVRLLRGVAGLGTSVIAHRGDPPGIEKKIAYQPASVKYYTLNVWSRGKQLVLFSRES